MTDKLLYDKHIELEEIHNLLEKYRKDFVRDIRGNDEFYKIAVKFVKKIEGVLSWYQLEMNGLSFQLINELRVQKQLIEIMESYGIDPAEALKRDAVHTVKPCHKVPEKLAPYINWDKVENDYIDRKAEELKKQFPHLKDKIDRIYKQ